MNGTRPRFVVLDGWRGLAALCVALYHLPVPGHFYLLPFLRGSYMFVDFFFVLSGFIISYSCRDRLTRPGGLASFIIRRFGRLWPLHAAMLALFIVAIFSIDGAATMFHLEGGTRQFRHVNDLRTAVSSFFLLHGLGFDRALSWNYPSWSISVEFWAYIVFAGLSVLAPRRTIGWALAAIAVGLGGLILYSHSYIRVSYDYGFFRVLYGFFTGHLVYRLWQRTHDRPPGFAHVLEYLCILVVVLFVSNAAGRPISLAAPIVFALVVFVFAHESGSISRIMRTPAFRHLGAWSYSIYMVHAMVVLVAMHGIRMYEALYHRLLLPIGPATDGVRGFDFYGSDYGMNLLALAYLGMVVGLAALTYRFVEQPGRRYFNALAERFEREPAEIAVPAKTAP